jgi:hypothetical protein
LQHQHEISEHAALRKFIGAFFDMKRRFPLSLTLLLLVLVGVWLAIHFTISEPRLVGDVEHIKDGASPTVAPSAASQPVVKKDAGNPQVERKVAFTKKEKMQHPALDRRELPVTPELSPQQIEALAQIQKDLPGV